MSYWIFSLTIDPLFCISFLWFEVWVDYVIVKTITKPPHDLFKESIDVYSAT